MNPFGDYFNRLLGYVLEGRVFRDENGARQYITATWGMTVRESQNYLKRLRYGIHRTGYERTQYKEAM